MYFGLRLIIITARLYHFLKYHVCIKQTLCDWRHISVLHTGKKKRETVKCLNILQLKTGTMTYRTKGRDLAQSLSKFCYNHICSFIADCITRPAVIHYVVSVSQGTTHVNQPELRTASERRVQNFI